MRAPLAIGGLLAALALISPALISIGCRRAGSSDAGRAPAFLARLEFPTANAGRSKPTGLIAGDLDGDGVDEIVAATRSPGGIEIWSRISPVIGPAPEPKVFAFGDYPIGPVWLGGDDAPRKHPRSLAAVASRETLDLAVIDLAASMKSSLGSELAVRWRAKLPARPRAIASGDLGRDGKPEVAVITIEDELLIYADPADPRRVKLAVEHPTCALISSDGAHIAVGYQGSRSVALLGADGAPLGKAGLPGLPRALAEMDVDGDGDGELVVAAGEESLVVFGLARPGGAAAWLDGEPTVLKVGVVPIDLEHADFDGDGREELLVLDLHSQDFRLLRWPAAAPGGAGAVSVLASAAVGQRPLGAAIGDFDGDGRLDMAFTNTDAKRVSVFFGAGGKPERRGARFVSETRVACDRAPVSIAAGDLDGDGLPEILVLAEAEGTLSVAKNDHGVLSPAKHGIPAKDAEALACADLDGDGKADTAHLERRGTNSAIVVHLADGRGGLTESAIVDVLPESRGASDLLLVDLDGDGKVDAVVADPVANSVALLRNVTTAPGKVEFSKPRILDDLSGPCALARMRGPAGALIIAVASSGPVPSRGIVLLRVGKSTSGEAELRDPVLLPMKQVPLSLFAADLDGDGREDLAVLATESGGDSPGFVIPWIAKADGGWRALDPLPTGQRPHRVVACDLDGDGRMELLATARFSHRVNVWIAHAGDPVGYSPAPDLGAGTGPLDLKLFDLDGDGRPEIVVGNVFSDDLSVIRVK